MAGLPKPNNIVEVKAGPDTGFFRWWLVFLRPFIKLTDREMDVVASFLRQRWELSKRVPDPAILDSMLMGDGVKKKVMEECRITQEHFYVVMSKLRKNKVIVGGALNPRLIPNVREGEGYFQLLILFDMK